MRRRIPNQSMRHLLRHENSPFRTDALERFLEYRVRETPPPGESRWRCRRIWWADLLLAPTHRDGTRRWAARMWQWDTSPHNPCRPISRYLCLSPAKMAVEISLKGTQTPIVIFGIFPDILVRKSPRSVLFTILTSDERMNGWTDTLYISGAKLKCSVELGGGIMNPNVNSRVSSVGKLEQNDHPVKDWKRRLYSVNKIKI